MKKQVVVLFLIISLMGIACASCDNNQTIVKLSSGTNAHAALWNDASYNTQVCYNEIFGVDYAGSNPHDCTTGNANKIVGLSSAGNAHAEIPSASAYTIPVCYGNLVCVNRASCNSDERLVVSLSANTNAHVSNSSDYSVKICCKQGTGVGAAYWANMANSPIASADLNDSVKLFVSGSGFESQTINFTVYKSVPFWWDSKIATSSGLATANWRPTSSGTYYFKASPITNPGNIITSDNLAVSSIKDNDQPVVRILTPLVGAAYILNHPVNFTSYAYDSDDGLNYLWNLDEGMINRSTNTVQRYATPGQKHINLTVTEDRTDSPFSVINRTSIAILDNGITVFAMIDSPMWGASFASGIVNFDSSSSYAVEATGCPGSCHVECLAGRCPMNLTNDVGGEGAPIYDTGVKRGSYDNLNFTWVFDGINNRYEGSDTSFIQTFTGINSHHAGLTVTYTS